MSHIRIVCFVVMKMNLAVFQGSSSDECWPGPVNPDWNDLIIAKKREFHGFRDWITRMSGKTGSKDSEDKVGLSAGPFGALDGLGDLPAGPGAPSGSTEALPAQTSQRGQKNTNRGRVDIIRQTAHRGGKGVTVAKNFKGIGLPEKQELAKLMQKACGVGGTVKDGCIEIQGDKREEMKRILTEAGFKPVFSGG
jgi:translation initiation factor 1